MNYYECPIYCNLQLSDKPLVSNVKLDEFTEMVAKNFDYEFDGKSKFYPFKFPDIDFEYKILCIVGASGSGKSTMLDQLNRDFTKKAYDNNAIVSNFSTPEEACDRLSSVGLNSMPVWCRPRRVLSVGEGFRADVALNLCDNAVFDEFTSTIDRNVAKSTCKGIKRFVDKHNLKNIIFCSCHKDYIPFLRPDVVVDLDKGKVFDCRGYDLGELLPYKSIKQTTKICGEYLGSITI